MTRKTTAILVVAMTAAAVIVTSLDPGAPVRPLVITAFLLICPGLAFVHLTGVKDITALITVSIAVSLVLDTLIASVMAYSGAWSPEGALLVLAFTSLLGTATAFVGPGRVALARSFR
jgi:predicted membrane protein